MIENTRLEPSWLGPTDGELAHAVDPRRKDRKGDGQLPDASTARIAGYPSKAD